MLPVPEASVPAVEICSERSGENKQQDCKFLKHSFVKLKNITTTLYKIILSHLKKCVENDYLLQEWSFLP